jgi:protein SCO1/2
MHKHFRWLGFIVFAFLLSSCTPEDSVEQNSVEQKFSLIDITGAPWGKDFNLIDHNGIPRSIGDFKDKATIVFFGYTNCPDMCPMTLYKLSQVVEKLGEEGSRVQVLFVTLDPKRDTPEVLKQYTTAFHPTFLGMYAAEETIFQTAEDFKVFYQHQTPNESGFYTVDHMGPSFVFDPQGRLRLFIDDEHSTEVIAADIKTLLDAPG